MDIPPPPHLNLHTHTHHGPNLDRLQWCTQQFTILTFLNGGHSSSSPLADSPAWSGMPKMGEVATRYSRDRVEPEASQNRTVPSSWLKPSSTGLMSHQTGLCSQESPLSLCQSFHWLECMWVWVRETVCMWQVCLCVCVCVCVFMFVLCAEGREGLGGEGRKGMSQMCTN